MRYTIEGGNLPAAIISLDAGDSMISESGGRMWYRGSITTETKGQGLGKAMGRLLTGESLFISTYTANGPSEIAFASSLPGCIVPIALREGQTIICQKTAFLCATRGTDLSIFLQKKIGAGLLGGEGFLMEKITGPGLVFLEVDGFCKQYTLAPGEKMVCDTGSMAIMDASCSMNIELVKGVKNMFFGGEGLFNMTLTGPGRVFLQTITAKKLASLVLPYMPNSKGGSFTIGSGNG